MDFSEAVEYGVGALIVVSVLVWLILYVWGDE